MLYLGLFHDAIAFYTPFRPVLGKTCLTQEPPYAATTGPSLFKANKLLYERISNKLSRDADGRSNVVLCMSCVCVCSVASQSLQPPTNYSTLQQSKNMKQLTSKSYVTHSPVPKIASCRISDSVTVLMLTLLASPHTHSLSLSLPKTIVTPKLKTAPPPAMTFPSPVGGELRNVAEPVRLLA